MHGQLDYLPASGHDKLLGLYDPLTRLLGVPRAQAKLIELAALAPGQAVLEVGCGTGNVMLMIAQHMPRARITGLDPDPKALARTRDKLARAGVSAQLDKGYANALPYADGTFNRVFSSLMYHHLKSEDRPVALREMRRVLKRGGELHLMDFDGPSAPAHNWLTRLIHSSKQLRDNDPARILGWMREAGFAHAEKVADSALRMGQVAYYKAY